MALTSDEIPDLVTGTLRNLGRGRFNQIAQTLQRFEAMGRVMRKENVFFSSGTGLKRTLMLNQTGAAKMTGLHAVDDVNIGELLAAMDVPWRRTTTNMAWEVREVLENTGDYEQIVDIVKARRVDMMIGLAELMETQFWGHPTDSSDDLNAWGMAYWLVYNATAGFNGTSNATIHDDGNVAGIAPATYARWANYTDKYVSRTKTDLVKKMRLAHLKIDFQSPVTVNDFRTGRGDQYRIYLNADTLLDLETIAEEQNDKLGRDIASMDGVTVFRRHPLIYIPKLDGNADWTDPVVMINWAWWGIAFLRGDYLRQGKAKEAPNQHNTIVVHVDLSWSPICTNRRQNALIASGEA